MPPLSRREGGSGKRSCRDWRGETSSLVRTVPFVLAGDDQGEETALRNEAVGEEDWERDFVSRSSWRTSSIRIAGLCIGLVFSGVDFSG